MALFKIKKGVKANLPTSYVEGYCYFTTDDGKFYIDTSNAASGRILLNAGTADKLTTTSAGSSTKPIYWASGKPVALSATVGSSSQPVYLNNGTITACTDIYVEGSEEESHIVLSNDQNALLTKTVYYFSATEKSGCWHYDEQGNVALWA